MPPMCGMRLLERARRARKLPVSNARTDAHKHELGMWPETIECTLPPFEAWDAPAREWMRPAHGGSEAASKRPAPRARGARAGKVARSNGDERRR